MESSNSGRKTILCAEDDEDQLTARKLVFESAGFNVAVWLAPARGFAIVPDQSCRRGGAGYWMPRMKGLSVAREMKQLQPNTPILVFSGFSSSLPDERSESLTQWLQKRDAATRRASG